MIRRREFITILGGAMAWPLFARAQQRERMRRVGVLSFGTDGDYSSLRVRNMSEELEKLGWIEGRNLHLEYRFGSGDASKTRQFAANLVEFPSEVIVATFGTALRALQRETKVIPIVAMGAGDLIVGGAVKDAARPVTGRQVDRAAQRGRPEHNACRVSAQ
jgi:putative tryptophan/tyrosine transport system substrate-binding protein